MNGGAQPVRAAEVVDARPLPIGSFQSPRPAWTYGAWIFVCAINMAVPLFFSATLTEEHGKLGMVLAVVSFFICGCFLCAFQRDLALAVIIGGVVVAMTQLMPILQIVAGTIGLAVGDALGVADFGNDERVSEPDQRIRRLCRDAHHRRHPDGRSHRLGLSIQWFRSRRRLHRSKNSADHLLDI